MKLVPSPLRLRDVTASLPNSLSVTLKSATPEMSQPVKAAIGCLHATAWFHLSGFLVMILMAPPMVFLPYSVP